MFKNIKARTIYKFIDGKDESKSFESSRIGQVKINNILCELLNYFTMMSDGGFLSKATLDVCVKEFDSPGLGTYLEFSDWDVENAVLSADFSKTSVPVSLNAGDYQHPAALIFLPKLGKGCIIFFESKSGGFDVIFDYYIKEDKARIGSHVIRKGKILRPADRVEMNQCIYTFDANCINDVKTFYNARVKKVVNVNPGHTDLKIWASDSRIIMGDLD